MSHAWMSMNAQGVFYGYNKSEDNPLGTKYTVKFGLAGDTGYPEEVEMSGESPFVVRYETSSTPFDPIRVSTATIQIVAPDAPVGMLSSHPQGSFCELWSGPSADTLVWKGYLKSNIYNVPLNDCNDVIQLEASDCLASLQYLDYTTENGDSNIKHIVTFHSILSRAVAAAGLTSYFWSSTKESASGQTIYPSELTISEHNFFSSDTNEPWKWSEVIEELCRYMGFTAIQWGDTLVLFDYRKLKSASIVYGYKYTGNTSSYTHYGGYQAINQPAIKLTGADMSYETMYNKISVRDNFYIVEEFIPDLFKEDYLTNRLGEKWQSGGIDVPNPTKPKFFKPKDIEKWKKGNPTTGKVAEEETADTKYSYYQKLWDNQYYESHYYTTAGTEVWGVSPTDMTDYCGGTLCTYATDSNVVVKSSLDWKNYLLCAKMIERENTGAPILNLKANSWNQALINTGELYLILNAKALWTRYNDRPYQNPDWCKEASRPAIPWTGGTYFGQNEYTKLYFAIGFGDWFWNGSSWSQNETMFEVDAGGWNNSETEVTILDTLDEFYLKDFEIVNNLSWETFADGDGYAIPIPPNIPIDGNMTFSIGMPGEMQKITIYTVTDPEYLEITANTFGGFCWLSDISLELTCAGAAKNRDADVAYTNEIDTDSCNEMSDITVKFTTYVPEGKPSYSTVGYQGHALEKIWEMRGNGTVAQKPEENIVEKYVEQYSVPRMKENYTVGMWFNPFSQIGDTYWNKTFCMLGCEIDYYNNRQRIEIVEI